MPQSIINRTHLFWKFAAFNKILDLFAIPINLHFEGSNDIIMPVIAVICNLKTTKQFIRALNIWYGAHKFPLYSFYPN